jgi:uncharacterized membrane protein
MDPVQFVIILVFLAFVIALYVAIYKWAEGKNRSGVGWCLAAFIITPLVVLPILMLVGKKESKDEVEFDS